MTKSYSPILLICSLRSSEFPFITNVFNLLVNFCDSFCQFKVSELGQITIDALVSSSLFSSIYPAIIDNI